MNTTSAAAEAHVTAATIRTWCRTRVLTATKQAGRWIIDTASLARRIAIAAWKKTTVTEQPANRCATSGNEARELVTRLAPPADIKPRSTRDRIRPEYRIREIAQSAAVNYSTAARYYESGDTEAGQRVEEQAAHNLALAKRMLGEVGK